MNKNMIIIVLIGVILALLLPLTGTTFSTEQAFTPDNLIQVNLDAK